MKGLGALGFGCLESLLTHTDKAAEQPSHIGSFFGKKAIGLWLNPAYVVANP